MMPLLAGGLGAIGGLGILLVVAGLRSLVLVPRKELPDGRTVQLHLATLAVSMMLAITAYAATGWAVLAVAVFLTALASRSVLASRRHRHTDLERSRAIASWAELIRDNISGASGLEQAVVVAAEHAPEAIVPEMQRFTARTDRRPLNQCLALLGEDLDHPAADMVVVALIEASQQEARDLPPLLSRLSTAIRADVRMQQRIDVGRARIRTSARIVAIVTGLTVVLLLLTAPQLLVAYSTANGQLWLAAVIGVFAGSGLMMRELSRGASIPRFRANRQLFASQGEQK